MKNRGCNMLAFIYGRRLNRLSRETCDAGLRVWYSVDLLIVFTLTKRKKKRIKVSRTVQALNYKLNFVFLTRNYGHNATAFYVFLGVLRVEETPFKKQILSNISLLTLILIN